MKEFLTKLSGVTFGDSPNVIQECRTYGIVFCTVDRELDNPKDPNAVSVGVNHQFRLGYVPRGIAPIIAKEIDAGKQFEAEILAFKQIYATGPIGVQVRIYSID
jgi:hypothetical protein